MPSTRCLWNFHLAGTNQTSHDPRLFVLDIVVRRRSVFHDIGGGMMPYGYPMVVATNSIVLPRVFLRLPFSHSGLHIEHELARFGVDRRNQSYFAMRIFRAARGLSGLHLRGFRMTATLDLTMVEVSEVEGLVLGEVTEQLDSESGHVMRGASKSTILGLKEKAYDAEDSECCSICLEQFHRREKVTELPCSHVFHRPCIIRWLESNNSCPLCRCRLDS